MTVNPYSIHFPSLGKLLQETSGQEFVPSPPPVIVNELITATTCQQLQTVKAEDLFYQRLLWQFSSAGLLNRIQKLIGFDRLLPDPHLFQAGIMTTQEMAALHFANRHPDTQLSRCISIIVNLSAGAPQGSCLITSDPSAEIELLSDTELLLVLHYYRPE
jgi:hypothetical protein